MTLSCAVTVIKFCVGLGKSPAEMMKLIRSSEIMNPCSVSASTSGMKDSGMEENQRRTDSGDGPPCVVKMTMKDITF